MGVVSGAVLINGGKVIGVLPGAMVAAGGEGEKVDSATVYLNEVGREKVLYLFLYNPIPNIVHRWKMYVISLR